MPSQAPMALAPGYIIENIHNRNWAIIVNDNDGDDVISGTDADETAGHKWEVRRLCNGKFILRNQRFQNYASYKLTDLIGDQAAVVSIRTGTTQHWCINRTSLDVYWISDLDGIRCWTLSSNYPHTPIALEAYTRSNRQHWRLVPPLIEGEPGRPLRTPPSDTRYECDIGVQTTLGEAEMKREEEVARRMVDVMKVVDEAKAEIKRKEEELKLRQDKLGRMERLMAEQIQKKELKVRLREEDIKRHEQELNHREAEVGRREEEMRKEEEYRKREDFLRREEERKRQENVSVNIIRPRSAFPSTSSGAIWYASPATSLDQSSNSSTSPSSTQTSHARQPLSTPAVVTHPASIPTTTSPSSTSPVEDIMKQWLTKARVSDEEVKQRNELERRGAEARRKEEERRLETPILSLLGSVFRKYPKPFTSSVAGTPWRWDSASPNQSSTSSSSSQASSISQASTTLEADFQPYAGYTPTSGLASFPRSVPPEDNVKQWETVRFSDEEMKQLEEELHHIKAENRSKEEGGNSGNWRDWSRRQNAPARETSQGARETREGDAQLAIQYIST